MIPIYIPRIFGDSAKKAIDSSWISSQGEYIEKTKKLLSEKFNIPYTILMNNGTSATHMLIKALKFKHPSINKIYVPNNVFVAVWNVIIYEYPKECIEMLDMDPLTLNMNVDEKYILNLEKNSAVMVVHNIGNIVNVPRLKRLRPDIIFIEDNCEGMFGKYENIYTGTSSSSLCSAVSFFANKTITCGEGGAFFTHDEDIYNYIYKTINHGISNKKYIYETLGYNYRMTNIQAALLYDQLLNLDKIIEDKDKIFKKYEKELKNIISIPNTEDNTQKSNWIFICGIEGPYESFELFMKGKNIDIRPFFYDIQLHAHLKYIDSKEFKLNKTYIMLPSYPDLKDEEQNYIIESIKLYIHEASSV